MERKIIKNYTTPHKKYLINLIKIFNSIQNQLKKIPQFDCNSLIQLQGINEDCIKKSPPERQIKKQHEVKLFQQTFEQICLINKKKPRGRKSDIVMKFTMVSNILIQRMKQSLCIKGESKELLLHNISKLKDSFMTWGQNSLILQKQSHSSQTNINHDYNLKYVFSQLATTNASVNHSRAMSKHHVKKGTKEEEENRMGEDNQESNLDDSSFKLHPKMLGRHQRYTVNYNLQNHGRKIHKLKKYTKNYMQTQQKKNPIEQTYIQNSINIKQKVQEIQRKPRKKTNFYEKSSTTVHKNTTQTNGNGHQYKCSSDQLIEEQKQMKKSAYFMSQNYIRSRKNIENITLFVNANNKTKKQINNLFLNIQPKNQADFDGVFFQRTSGFKSTKFLTKKYIPDDQNKPTILQTKSEKMIPRKPSAFISKGGNTHAGGFYDKKPISKFHKNTQEDIQQIRLDRPPQFLKKQFTSIKQENGIEIIDSKVNPQSTIQGKNIGQFYNELGQMRSQFQRQFDPYLQSRSVFFQQQSTIWDEQKRRLQRVLGQRSRQLYFRQFKMEHYTSHRQQQQALKAIRSDIFNYNQSPHVKLFSNSALDQIDLNKQTV